MNRPHGKRARLGGMLLAAAAAIAVLALPGLAASHGPKHDRPADAGVIESFDAGTGVLTIDLTDGDSVSGLVTRRTHIRCGPPPRRGRGHGRVLRQRGPEGVRPPGPAGPRSTPEPGDDPPGHDGTAPGRSEDPGKGAERSARCNVEDLVPGATVKVAELVLINGNAYYKMVGLPKQAPPADEEA